MFTAQTAVQYIAHLQYEYIQQFKVEKWIVDFFKSGLTSIFWRLFLPIQWTPGAADTGYDSEQQEGCSCSHHHANQDCHPETDNQSEQSVETEDQSEQSAETEDQSEHSTETGNQSQQSAETGDKSEQSA